MAQSDLHNNVEKAVALNVSAISTDTTTAGNIIDMQGFDSLEFLILSGTLTDGTYTPLVEHGEESNLRDAAAVADTFLLGTEAGAAFAAADDNEVHKLGYVGDKRYVRLSIVSASTSSGGTLGAVAVQGHPSNGPVTTQA